MDIAIYLILYAMQNTTSYRSFRRITYQRSLSLLSTKGSREVYSCNAFKRIVGPGEMFPPKYSADELIKS